MVGSAIAGVLGAGASLIGASKSADAAEDAAAMQAQATREATELQREQFETTREDLRPWRETGQAGLGVMSDMFIPGGQTAVQGPRQLEQLQGRRNDILRQMDELRRPRGGGEMAQPDFGTMQRQYNMTVPGYRGSGPGPGGDAAGTG